VATSLGVENKWRSPCILCSNVSISGRVMKTLNMEPDVVSNNICNLWTWKACNRDLKGFVCTRLDGGHKRPDGHKMRQVFFLGKLVWCPCPVFACHKSCFDLGNIKKCCRDLNVKREKRNWGVVAVIRCSICLIFPPADTFLIIAGMDAMSRERLPKNRRYLVASETDKAIAAYYEIAVFAQPKSTKMCSFNCSRINSSGRCWNQCRRNCRWSDRCPNIVIMILMKFREFNRDIIFIAASLVLRSLAWLCEFW